MSFSFFLTLAHFLQIIIHKSSTEWSHLWLSQILPYTLSSSFILHIITLSICLPIAVIRYLLFILFLFSIFKMNRLMDTSFCPSLSYHRTFFFITEKVIKELQPERCWQEFAVDYSQCSDSLALLLPRVFPIEAINSNLFRKDISNPCKEPPPPSKHSTQ